VARVLSLDVGTSSVRARLYGPDGLHVEGVEAHTKYTGESGRFGEFDPDGLVDATRAAIEEARAGTGGEVDAVAASCFWHSLLAVDSQGKPLTPVLTWRDTRSAAEADELAARLGWDELHARTGCPPHTSYWPAKLLWLSRNEPEAFRSADRFLSFSDYLYGQLVGSTATSLSMASGTGLLDLADIRWDEELLAALELSLDRLPELSDEPAGASEPWFPALGDGACSNLGVDCVTRERAALMIGTSGAFRTAYQSDEPKPRPGLFLYRLDDRRLVEGGSVSDGGNLRDWLERTLALSGPVGLDGAPADGHGLTFLTLLGGERSPGWNSRARGAVTGLTFATEPRDIAQAALEGAAYRFAEIADLMPEVQEIVGTGAGLLKNPAWAHVIADVLGKPILLSGIEEGSARGAAVFVLERLGETPAEAPLGETLEPRPDRTGIYRAARERARALYRELT
jgi:gluconokinase